MVLPANLQLLKDRMKKPTIVVIKTHKNSVGEYSHVKFKVDFEWKDGTKPDFCPYITPDHFEISVAEQSQDAVLYIMYRYIAKLIVKQVVESSLQNKVNEAIDREFGV